MKYDVLIVGAGIAGASLAWDLAGKGLKVLVVDSRPFNRFGDKPCGDAVSKAHFDDLGMPYPTGNQLENVIHGIKLYSPDKKTEWVVKGDGFEINSPAYVQRLVKEAMNKEVEVMDMTTAMKPIFEDGFVKGAILYDRKTNQTFTVEAKITVDATGYSMSFRNKLPKELPISEELDDKDADVAYREVTLTKDDMDDYDYLKIYITQQYSPGGYWWIFPKGKDKVNVGLGIQGGMGYPPVQSFYEKYLNEIAPEVDRSKLLVKGGALVPTRRPITTMTWNGIAVIGDSAFTVNPVHGGGKGSAMISAYCVSKSILSAFKKGDFSAPSLWDANICFIEKYGAKQAGLDIFRRFLQRLTDEDINYGMNKRVLKEEDIVEASMSGDIHMSVAEKAMRIIAGLGRPSLLFKLKTVADYMKRMKNLYYNYPKDPKNLNKWKASVNELVTEFINAVS